MFNIHRTLFKQMKILVSLHKFHLQCKDGRIEIGYIELYHFFFFHRNYPYMYEFHVRITMWSPILCVFTSIWVDTYKSMKQDFV